MTRDEINEMGLYEGPERLQFEETIYAQYFITHATPTQGLLPGTLSKAQLMRRDEQGQYEDEAISAMWYGWWLRSKALGIGRIN